MEGLIRGDIVVIPFPFSDLTSTKRRPALVLGILEQGDVVLCQITSRFRLDSLSIPLKKDDFTSGELPVDSFVRCGKLFTANSQIVLRKAAAITAESLAAIADRNVKVILGELP